MTPYDQRLVLHRLGSFRAPDLVIDNDHGGDPYLYRWHIMPRNDMGGVYLHIQTASDPERPLHDHPWDNMSVILAGGYDEIAQPAPPYGDVTIRQLRPGSCMMRSAEVAHRLILPEGIKYSISQFTMGARRREWGFWIDGKWYPYQECTRTANFRTVFRYPPGTEPPPEETAVS